jgi:hypothetical protein
MDPAALLILRSELQSAKDRALFDNIFQRYFVGDESNTI